MGMNARLHRLADAEFVKAILDAARGKPGAALADKQGETACGSNARPDRQPGADSRKGVGANR